MPQLGEIEMKNYGLMFLAVGLLSALGVMAAQDTTLTQRQVRDPRQLEVILEANATDAESRLTAIEAGVQVTSTIITNAYTIDSDDYGTMILVNTNAAVAITLPANGAAAGSWVDVAVHSTATDSCVPTIATATADTLIIIGAIDGDSVTYGTGHRIGALCRFWSDGAFWHYANLGPTTITENDSD